MKVIFGFSLLLVAGLAIANGPGRKMTTTRTTEEMTHMNDAEMREHNRKHRDQMNDAKQIQAEEENNDTINRNDRMNKDTYRNTNSNRTMTPMRTTP